MPNRIARHFDARVADRLAKCQDPGLVVVSEPLREALLPDDRSVAVFAQKYVARQECPDRRIRLSQDDAGVTAG